MHEGDYSVRFIDHDSIPEAFIRAGIKRHFKKNEIVINYRDPPIGCFLVMKGLIGAIKLSSNGNEFFSILLEPHNVFYEVNALFEDHSTCQFKALESSTLLFVDAKTLRFLFETDSDVTRFLANSGLRKMRAIVKSCDEIRSASVTQRICNVLLEYADKYGMEVEGRLKIDYPISQQYIANLLGVNRITVTKSFKHLRSLNLLHKIDDSYCLSDPHRLERFRDSIS
jgi:CRP/FNR family transcriptional regulator